MTKKSLFIAVFILLLILTNVFASCAREGALPLLSIGDKWVTKCITPDSEFLITTEITGEDITDGIDCYIMKYTFDPPNQGVIDSAIMKYNKADLSLVRMEVSAEVEGEPFKSVFTYTYDITEPSAFPFTVGKEYKEIQYETEITTIRGQTETKTDTIITISKIEKMEEITVAAGTFKCFKILKYDEQGNLISTSWHSDKVKTMSVKTIDAGDGGKEYELISYSFQ